MGVCWFQDSLLCWGSRPGKMRPRLALGAQSLVGAARLLLRAPGTCQEELEVLRLLNLPCKSVGR